MTLFLVWDDLSHTFIHLSENSPKSECVALARTFWRLKSHLTSRIKTSETLKTTHGLKRKCCVSKLTQTRFICLLWIEQPSSESPIPAGLQLHVQLSYRSVNDYAQHSAIYLLEVGLRHHNLGRITYDRAFRSTGAQRYASLAIT